MNMKKDTNNELKRRLFAAKSAYQAHAKTSNFPVVTFCAKYGIEDDTHLRTVMAGQHADEEITLKVEMFVEWILTS